MIRLLAIFLIFGLSGCISDSEYGKASKDQIEAALSSCGVSHRDFARDGRLNDNYLIIIHADETAAEAKMRCITDQFEKQGVMAAITYPEPADRTSLHG